MMFIKKIIEENSAKESGESEKDCTELVQVKKAIEKLNGEDKTVVVLRNDEKNFMLIGGGQSGKYIVLAQLKGKMYAATNKYAVPKGPVELTVSGKKEAYPSKRCLNLEMVLEAAKHYADRGALAQVFDWEKP
jgi:hypothetical protein